MTESYDVAIIGGGSAGLAALRQLSNLGKQTILLEAGKQVGTKNISGGILYSKKPKSGRAYNVEDVYGPEFMKDAPVERRITQYMLHSTSRNKVFTMNLTAAHEYQANFGYSVLLNPLNAWFAKHASESAEKQGGGIVSGVHVRSLKWQGEKVVIETDELDPFEAKAVIAADGHLYFRYQDAVMALVQATPSGYVERGAFTLAAKRGLTRVPLREGRTLHHDVFGRHGAGKVFLRAAPPGTGIIAGGPMRAVFETLGVQDVVAKSFGSSNPYNMVRATFDALKREQSPRSVAARSGKKVSEIMGRRREGESAVE